MTMVLRLTIPLRVVGGAVTEVTDVTLSVNLIRTSAATARAAANPATARVIIGARQVPKLESMEPPSAGPTMAPMPNATLIDPIAAEGARGNAAAAMAINAVNCRDSPIPATVCQSSISQKPKAKAVSAVAAENTRVPSTTTVF